ncbi:MAG: diaminobutyrate--2-oxoglutarate transaminase [Gammaproteobacteria bacterium]|jgi:diaminobutyrate-2-oxoglutarate transaminase
MLMPFDMLESKVRSYCRDFPTIFRHARGEILEDKDGRTWIDFFAGAGALNYGHNDPHIKSALMDYLQEDSIIHGLDLATVAKGAFLERLQDVILEPRGLKYKVMFPGPTGTNAVEAALKLARKATGRTSVMSFVNGFHGMTLGSLSVTGNAGKRDGAGVPLQHVTHVPFDGYLNDGGDSLGWIAQMLEDPSSGVDKPAAFIAETVQAEGGVNVASDRWLQGLQALARKHGIILIIDDIQVGCGRTGPFFSFEQSGIEPDIVCLSKSLSGLGLPLAVTLLRPELDVFTPGQHNGTFRGHNPAFVTAVATLEHYWRDEQLTVDVQSKGSEVRSFLNELADDHPDIRTRTRGLGLIQGIEFVDSPEIAEQVSRRAFEHGLIIETAGGNSQVLKILPPLTIPRESLHKGLEIIGDCVDAVCPSRAPHKISHTH